MNIRAAPRTRIAIEVVHDLVCPWCFLGVRRLLRAVRRRGDVVAELTWRPFLLNPDMPRVGMARYDYVMRKFGSEERGRRLYQSISELGASEGVPFRFDRIHRTPSSIDAHRLVRFASACSGTIATDLVEALFVAHFADGRDIGDQRVLVTIAAENGLDPLVVRRFLARPDGIDMVHAENLRSHRIGINGVPCFILGDGVGIAGAQEPEVIERLLDIAILDVAVSP